MSAQLIAPSLILWCVNLRRGVKEICLRAHASGLRSCNMQTPNDRHLDYGREMGIVMSIGSSVFGIPQCAFFGCVIEPKELSTSSLGRHDRRLAAI